MEGGHGRGHLGNRLFVPTGSSPKPPRGPLGLSAKLYSANRMGSPYGSRLAGMLPMLALRSTLRNPLLEGNCESCPAALGSGAIAGAI
jgi:hypothetical protein